MKYTKEFCNREAANYKLLKDFRNEKPSIYGYIIKHKWQDVISHLTKSSGSYYRYIYVYEFKNLNSAYIGLTYNIRKRHENHKKSGTVFKFAKENKIDLQYPIILESNVVYTEAGKRENFYVELYRKNGWNILNKAKPGGLGSGRKCNKQIVMFDANGDFVDKDKKINIIEKYGILGQNISNCLSKRFKSAGGYMFMYENEWKKIGSPQKIEKLINNRQDEIIILTNELDPIKILPSKKEAMAYCGYKWRGNNLVQLRRNTIANCNKGKCAFYLDYLKYIDGELELYDPKIPKYKKLYLLPYDNEERKKMLSELIEGPKWVKNKNKKRLKPFRKDLHKPNDYVSPRAKALMQFDFDGNFIKEYGSARVFVKEKGLKSGRHICDAAIGKRNTSNGYIWIYKNDYSDELLKERVEKVKYKNKESVIETPPVNVNK